MVDKNENRIIYFFIILLIIISITTIIIKEYNRYYTNKSINEIKNSVVKINKNNVDTNNNGKLVLLRGKINESENYLSDPLFNINTKATKLYRNVEIYQWVEIEEKDENGKTVYRYEKKWSNEIIKSNKYKKHKNENPTKKVIKSQYFNHDTLTIGEYVLSKQQMKDLPCHIRLRLGNNNISPEGFTIFDNYFTNSINPENPEIGDYRISYYYSDWAIVTVLAKQDNNSFKNYVTKKKEKINYLGPGKQELDIIIDSLPLIK